MTENNVIFLGKIISPRPADISVLNGYLSVQNGKITSKGTSSEYQTYKRSINPADFDVMELAESQFLLPGFIDCHVHAPQFPNLGMGLDRPLLDWLNKYTFPLEKKYEDEEFATRVYNQVVARLLKNGTTTACYFGSLHAAGTLRLAESVVRLGQRALVGKVSMNIPNDAGYFNSTQRELADLEAFVVAVKDLKNDLVEPIITPRFALSCDSTLMKELSSLAKKFNCQIQSHLSENQGEVQCVLATYREANSYAQVYDQHGILTDKCIMAHAIHLSADEMACLEARGVSVAHCPASNTRLMSGLCPVRRLLRHNITVGLGTDVAGGDSTSVLDAARRCVDVASHRQLQGESDASVSWREALYMATLGGAKALHLDDKIGDFSIGKEFDALLIDTYEVSGPITNYGYEANDSEDMIAEGLLQRFFYLGDDRNIKAVYVKGKERKSDLLSNQER